MAHPAGRHRWRRLGGRTHDAARRHHAIARADGAGHGDPGGPLDALNDLVVTRGARPRAVRVSVSIDDQHLQTYVADGVIVSTPTGSTAYALAMDGPIVHPELRSLQVTPIAPHLTVVRSIVVPPSATVTLTMHTATLPRPRSTARLTCRW